MSLVVAVDASTSRGTVALIRDATVVCQLEAPMRGADGEQLMPLVSAALDEGGASWRDLGMVVCGRGPGSFTSLRIAAGIAKGIAFATGAPLSVAPSLALVVASHAPPPGRYLVAMDAMRGELFTSLVVMGTDGEIAEVGVTERILRAASSRLATSYAASLIVVGDDSGMSPHARGAARLLGTPYCVRVDVDSWEPEYGRAAEAQVRWEARHGYPLPAQP